MTHKIGDALYELVDGNWDGNGDPDRVLVYPVVKVTDKSVVVHGPHFWDHDKTYRLDRAKLEAEGCVYHRPNRSLIYTKPGIDWPMVVLDVNNGTRALNV